MKLERVNVMTSTARPELLMVVRQTYRRRHRAAAIRRSVSADLVVDRREHHRLLERFLDETLTDFDPPAMAESCVEKFYAWLAMHDGHDLDAIAYAGVTPHYAWRAREQERLERAA